LQRDCDPKKSKELENPDSIINPILHTARVSHRPRVAPPAAHLRLDSGGR